jgi:capsular polysaccharide export protein
LGINAYVYEFGYLRPDWLTLERHGMTQWSHFPNQPEVIRAIGKAMPPPDLKSRYPGSVAIELAHEVFYNLVSYFFHFTYPFYNADRYYNPLVEYITGIPQQLTAARHEHEAKGVISELKRARRSYFLFPLQLQNDYQLRDNSPFRHQSEAIHQVIESFARSARPDDVLVFKCHPMDNGGEHWGRHIADAASKHGVTARTRYIEGGALEDLINHASGIVLINSTTGVRALLAGKPVKVLGIALYDVPGLTHQGKLDEYWTAARAPDADLVDAFARAMAGTIQVKGNFFSRKGRRAAIPVFVERLLSGSVNGHGAFVDPPPRLQCFKDA